MLQRNGTVKDLLAYAFLGVFLIVAYLPVSSFLFALKNDALIANFPNKYFISASLASGHMPLWNPYMNFGLPLYADPGFAFWNPMTWIFGLAGYSIRSLSIEVLVYIWLGGIFMYRLGSFFSHCRSACFCMGAMYMCCGFFIGNLQFINFLTCAAFLPFSVHAFLRLLEKFSYSRLLWCAVSCYLLATGGHPAIPIGMAYFLTLLLAGSLLIHKRETPALSLLQAAKRILPLVPAFIGLAAPLLYSSAEILPHITRGAPILQNDGPFTLNTGFTVPSYLSFLFPLATAGSGNFFSNTALMRNGYFSFAGLSLFIMALIRPRNKYQLIFISAGAVMLLLSLGGSIKEIIYPHLPLLRYIGTNGEFRIFAIFSFIIAASFPLHSLLCTGRRPPGNDHPRSEPDLSSPGNRLRLPASPARLFNKILTVFAGIATLAALATLVSILHHSTPILSGNVAIPAGSGVPSRDKIKALSDQLTFRDGLLINSILLLALLFLYFVLKRKIAFRRLLPAILMTDLLCFSWLLLPFSGVQKKSVSEIAQYFSTAPPGIPLPSLTPVGQNDRPGENLEKIIGRWSYYSKQPGTPIRGNYPTIFTTTRNYFRSALPAELNQHPFIFLRSDIGPARTGDTSIRPAGQLPSSPPASLGITGFSPTEIVVRIQTSVPDTLVLLQNDYPHWNAWVEGRPAPVLNTCMSFMAVAVPAGASVVRFSYQDKGLILALWVSFFTLLTLSALAIREKKITRGSRDPREHTDDSLS